MLNSIEILPAQFSRLNRRGLTEQDATPRRSQPVTEQLNAGALDSYRPFCKPSEIFWTFSISLKLFFCRFFSNFQVVYVGKFRLLEITENWISLYFSSLGFGQTSPRGFFSSLLCEKFSEEHCFVVLIPNPQTLVGFSFSIMVC